MSDDEDQCICIVEDTKRNTSKCEQRDVQIMEENHVITVSACSVAIDDNALYLKLRCCGRGVDMNGIRGDIDEQ